MKRFLLAVALAAVASIIVAGTASADVPRYQDTTQTGTITVSWQGGLFVHTFNVVVNPDGSFTGTGTSTQPWGEISERIVGTLLNGNLTYTATYDAGSPYAGYWWSYDGPAAGSAAGGSHAQSAFGEDWSVDVTYNLSGDTYKNHGDYVSSQGGGKDAAHSPIGMPLNSNSVK
jgi:hypothetical protein